jgi:hypothetical protein
LVSTVVPAVMAALAAKEAVAAARLACAWTWAALAEVQAAWALAKAFRARVNSSPETAPLTVRALRRSRSIRARSRSAWAEARLAAARDWSASRAAIWAAKLSSVAR